MLWEEVRGQEPKVDAARVQERILMRQEVRPRGAGPGVAVGWPLPHCGVASGCGETSFSPLFPSQVDKLRLLLLEKMDENSQLSDKYLEQVPAALRGPSSSHPLSPTLHLPFNPSSSHFPVLQCLLADPRPGAEAPTEPEAAEGLRGDAGEDEEGELGPAGALIIPASGASPTNTASVPRSCPVPRSSQCSLRCHQPAPSSWPCCATWT